MIFDSDTITTTSEEMVDSFTKKYPIVRAYVEKLRTLGHPDYAPGLAVVNGTSDTNLGLFRAYMCQWLLNNPAIRNDEQILVRIMDPSGEGIPLQIWCFTDTTNWTAYEAIQSAVMEHVAVTAADFGLRLFNDPSGTDITTVSVSGNLDMKSAPTGSQAVQNS